MTDEYDSWRRYEDAKAFKNKLAEIDQLKAEIDMLKNRIEKLEAALREIAQTVTIEDESWHPSYNDPRFTQKQAEGLAEALSARIKIARKALEDKDD